ncbi:MAG: hypothetical protein U0236_02995 [Nitrospira sp.]
MRQGRSNDITKEQERTNDSLESHSSMKVMDYFFNPDQGMWCGYLKGESDYQVAGESFDELQVKLQQLPFAPSLSVVHLVCSNNALISWYWQRQLSRIV